MSFLSNQLKKQKEVKKVKAEKSEVDLVIDKTAKGFAVLIKETLKMYEFIEMEHLEVAVKRAVTEVKEEIKDNYAKIEQEAKK